MWSLVFVLCVVQHLTDFHILFTFVYLHYCKTLITHPVCLTSVTGEDKIVGGYECTPHSQPHQVFLNSGYHFCGGALLSENWVVSAAHCYMSRVEVRLGEHIIGVNEGTEQFIRASRVIRHPFYNSYNNSNDIMLIKLSKPATLNWYVQPVALPTSCAPVGTIQTLIPDTILQCVDIFILPDDYCFYLGMTDHTIFCAGHPEGGKESCDSGSPLVCNGELQGVVSWAQRCYNMNGRGIYSKVCVQIDWLHNTMASY
uniref:trypsin n=1 Tax=Lates calcarifer TaxID=8187 RepID=A0A4W6BI17_LATCA